MKKSFTLLLVVFGSVMMLNGCNKCSQSEPTVDEAPAAVEEPMPGEGMDLMEGEEPPPSEAMPDQPMEQEGGGEPSGESH